MNYLNQDLIIIITATMETKQSAVEWLHSELHRQCMFDAFAWEDRNYFIKLLEQAKEMEKQQIIDAHVYGDENHTFNCMMREEYASDYYNETYGKVN